MALASQSGLTLDQFGARPVVGRLVSASMVKELGPVLTALMLTGRVGSGIAAELGSMVVTDQINALRALGTDPLRKLVVPRVIAGIFMAPALTAISDFIGILGGWVVARYQLQVNSSLYWASVTKGLYIDDVWMGVSKPFVFGMALEERGREAVMSHVGVEPSGNAFNAIAVDDTNRPFNPMVNAGAIVTTGLIARTDPSHALERVVDVFSAFAGRQLSVDESVYRSESATGDRNRALGFLMKSFGVLDGDVETAVDLYFKQCSLLVTARDLAVMAATLANRGMNPITGTRAIDEEYVENVLSVMSTCGMYDYAGEWGYRVGLTAKSGVAGAVVAVLPGQFGIGVFSPPLDAKGNSVRGILACRDLANELGLHAFEFTNVGSNFMQSMF
jgi:glutaminase